MKNEALYPKPSEAWCPLSTPSLTDTPLGALLGNSFFGSFDNNMLETADGYKLEIAVPGMRRKDLKLEVDDGVLTIQGHKQRKEVFGWIRKTVEYKNTQIYRTFSLPEDADADGIRATCKDGLLKISIPKIRHQSSSRYIPVEPAEDAREMTWQQQILRPFKWLGKKLSYMMTRLGFGTKQPRNLAS